MQGLFFSKSHEWANISGDEAIIGISDYAQRQLGDIVFIEMPDSGDSFNKQDQFGTIESTKAASEVYMPLNGKIIEINEDLVNTPELINQDPYHQGWLIKIKILDKGQVSELMDEPAYKDFVAAQEH